MPRARTGRAWQARQGAAAAAAGRTRRQGVAAGEGGPPRAAAAGWEVEAAAETFNIK